VESLKKKISPQQKKIPPTKQQPYPFFPGAFFAPQKTGLSAPIFLRSRKKDFRCNPWREDRRRFGGRGNPQKTPNPKKKFPPPKKVQYNFI
jgi:hypothetical protein